ncbi:MAG: hypothetical protein COA78_22680 [Blastopirellula sp.]|nr:MAG: hypothetical protein COA78_22680 [Blastopirellula sp.]
MSVYLAMKLFSVFIISVFIASQLVFNLPYVENWPYTGLTYGVVFLFAFLIVTVLFKHQFATKSNTSLPALSMTCLGFTLLCSSFLSFTGRNFTEREISYSFQNGEIIEKYKSSEHEYLSLKVKIEDEQIIRLENIKAETWNNLKAGDLINKSFGKPQVTLVD